MAEVRADHVAAFLPRGKLVGGAAGHVSVEVVARGDLRVQPVELRPLGRRAVLPGVAFLKQIAHVRGGDMLEEERRDRLAAVARRHFGGGPFIPVDLVRVHAAPARVHQPKVELHFAVRTVDRQVIVDSFLRVVAHVHGQVVGISSVDFQPVRVGDTALVVVVALGHGVGHAGFLHHLEDGVHRRIDIGQRLFHVDPALEVLHHHAFPAGLVVHPHVADAAVLHHVAGEDDQVGVRLLDGALQQVQHVP